MSRPAQRSMNFTLQETERLMELCVRFRHIICNKKSDFHTLQLKNATWKQIANVYNYGLKDRLRDDKSLKCRFINLKTSKCALFEKYKARLEADYGVPIPLLDKHAQKLTMLKQEYEIDEEDAEQDEETQQDATDDELNPLPMNDDDPLDALETLIDEEMQHNSHVLNETENDASIQIAPKVLISEVCVKKPNTTFKNVFSKYQNKPFTRGKRRRYDYEAKEQAEVTEELLHEQLLTAQEKRAQQRMQHNLTLGHAKAEFELKMAMMKEEHKLKKRKLELEILTLAKTLRAENNGVK